MRRFVSCLLPFVAWLSLTACAPITQVTNNSGFLIQEAKVAEVVFTEHIGDCAEGCSTAFKKVPRGHNRVSLQKAASSDVIDVGELGPFKFDWLEPKKYAVNVVTDAERVCAELWRRYQTDSTFNDDTTRVRITTVCR